MREFGEGVIKAMFWIEVAQKHKFQRRHAFASMERNLDALINLINNLTDNAHKLLSVDVFCIN